MSTRELEPNTAAMLRKAISDAYYEARNTGHTMEQAADAAVAALEPIIGSIDANAHLRGTVEALTDAARYFEYEMAPAWGGDNAWISTGSHVADLVAEILRERADEARQR